MRMKRVLAGGKGGELPMAEGTRLHFHFKAEALRVDKADGISVDSELEDSRKSWPQGYGEPMELVLGKQFSLPIWEKCLATMRLSEIASFDVDPPDLIPYPGLSAKLRDLAKRRDNPDSDHGHNHHHCFGMMEQTGLGYPELDALVKKPKAVRFTFELLKYEPPGSYKVDGWQMSPGEKLESIQILRTEGKESFLAGRLEEAAEKWKEALSRIESLQLSEKPGEPEWTVLEAQRIPFYLNLAQAWLDLSEPYMALQATTEVLQREPQNEKGLWRQAKAKAASWDLEGARRDLATFAQAHPKSAHLASKELMKLQELEKASRGQDLYRNMAKASTKE